MSNCQKDYAEFYRENAHRLPGLKRPEECDKTPNVVNLRQPTIPEMVANFVEATSEWTAAGFPIVTREVFERRLAACEACNLWDDKARFGLGKCKHPNCGCTKFKFWMANQKCPLKRWE